MAEFNYVKAYDKAIGQYIKNQRLEKHMTQTEVADKLGVTKSAISHYEQGDHSINASTLMRMCHILDFNYKQLEKDVMALDIEDLKKLLK